MKTAKQDPDKKTVPQSYSLFILERLCYRITIVYIYKCLMGDILTQPAADNKKTVCYAIWHFLKI